jgi:hypothetical protein
VRSVYTVWVDIYSRNVVNEYPVLSIIAPPFSMITANSSLVIRGQGFLHSRCNTCWTAYEWCGNVCIKATVTVV